MIKKVLLSLMVIFAFVACGGGGGSSSSKNITNKSYTVVDPYIQGATFFWDKNADGIKDANEPVSTSSDANGNFTFNVNIPVGETIVMLEKGIHNGITYTGTLSSVLTSKKVVSPLTTLEERYFKGKKEKLIDLLKTNGITLSSDDIDANPMTSNNVEHVIANLAIDQYLKLDKLTNVDKNGTELSSLLVSVKDLIDFDISKSNIEDTVSIMDYVMENIKEEGNLSQLSLLKESYDQRKKLKDILKNRADKTKPGRISNENGNLVGKKAKKTSNQLKNNIFSFNESPVTNTLVKLSIDINTTSSNQELSWSMLSEPTDSKVTLTASDDKKSVEFTPLKKGKYKVLFSLSDDNSLSKKIIEFDVSAKLEMKVSKVKGYSSDADTSKLLGEVTNQSWVSSFILSEAELTTTVNKYNGLSIVGYDNTYGLLISYDETNATVKDNLVSLQYEFGIGNVYPRVYEGKDAFEQGAIYPNDNGKFDDGGTNWHLEAINMPEAWEFSKGDDSFLIGVCDGGYDTKHKDLAGRFATILNSGDGGSNGNHGMAVTGAIGANTNNGIGISGINWNAQFVTSYMGTSYVKDVIDTKQDGKIVRLISNSWGVHLPSNFNPTDSYTATQRFTYLQRIFAQRKFMIESKQDKLFLWAAGNGVGNGRSTTGYYGVDSKYDNGATHYTNNVLNKLDNLLVVGAFKKNNNDYVLTYYSNYGESVDIAAPTEFDSLKLNNGIYSRFGGTSAATPVASAVASLVMTINPKLTPKEVKKILIDSATSKITHRFVTPYSSSLEKLAIPIPILNAKAALKMAKETITPIDKDTMPIDFMAELTDNFTPKATFNYFSLDKNYQVVNIKSTIKSSSDKTTYNTYGNNSAQSNIIEVSLDPNNRNHEISSELTLKHILTNEEKTQNHTQKFTYADMTINTKDAQSLLPIANASYKVFSSSIFKRFLIEGETDNAGTKKIYIPYNMYNLLGQANGYKDSGAQSMVFEDKSYTVNLLFGLSGTDAAGIISGIVSDQNGNPVDAAKVEIYNGSTLIKSTTTNSTGYYQLTDIKKKDGSGALITNFVIKVIKTNYTTQERENIIILDGKERQENFTLIGIPSNQPPVAVAGPDQIVLENEVVTLSSTGSADVDGTIVKYQWREGDTVLSNLESFTINNLSVGTHTLTLIITDDDNAIGADTVDITVNKLATYNWIAEDWGVCEGNCGVGSATQSRAINCKSNTGETVSDSFCKQLKPKTTQSCTASLCDTEYYWKVGEWGNCQGECGISNGVQNRDVRCQNQNNFSVKEELCTLAKPNATQNCSTAKCPFTFETITSGTTGRIWLDRNMGSSKKCGSIDDAECFGSYYQWGREDDGHELKSSSVVATVSNSIKVSHSDFISLNLHIATDWTSTDTNGANRAEYWARSDGYGVCPNGYRVPFIDELKAESIFNAEDGYAKLKLPSAGIRKYSDGTFNEKGIYVWSNTPHVSSTKQMQYTAAQGHVEVSAIRGFGMSVRCINDAESTNVPPIARIEADKTTIIVGNTVKFSAKTSSDSDGVIETYKWYEGDAVLSTSQDFSTYELTVGEHSISLKVTDNKGASHVTSISITVNDKPEYNWIATDWGNCIGECGANKGTQTRTITCKDKSDVIVTDDFCTQAKPALSQSCTESYCSTAYGEIISTETGRVWLDRNIGAQAQCGSIDDANCFGDYFQWGRNADGHEKATSQIVDNISLNIVPSHNYFIKSSFNYNYDWTKDDRKSTQRLQNWNSIVGDGVCPSGYRVPTKEEFIAEKISSSESAYSVLKLPIAGYRNNNGDIVDNSQKGYVFTSSLLANKALALKYETTNSGAIQFLGKGHSTAFNVRCIKPKDEEIIANSAPIANAGADKIITFEDEVILDGSQSYDSDGVITSYLWEQSDNTLSTEKSVTVSSLSVGTHIFKLTVTDNNGATSSDEVIVVVNEKLTYNWKVGAWGDCSGLCGNNNATQTRTVSCQDSANSIVADNLCTASKPSSSQICTEKLCIVFDTITSPVTGKEWMDRNLGASRVCTSFNDSLCYGDYYQWGRKMDGHEKLGSSVTSTLSSNIVVGTTDFILSTEENTFDWLTSDISGSVRTSSWGVTDGTSICPVGFRLPTSVELNAENIDSVSKAFANLKLPLAGLRDYETGEVQDIGYAGGLWSSTPNGTNAMFLGFGKNSDWSYYSRASGRSVRCIKE